jgi:hypothetical protein
MRWWWCALGLTLALGCDGPSVRVIVEAIPTGTERLDANVTFSDGRTATHQWSAPAAGFHAVESFDLVLPSPPATGLSLRAIAATGCAAASATFAQPLASAPNPLHVPLDATAAESRVRVTVAGDGAVGDAAAILSCAPGAPQAACETCLAPGAAIELTANASSGSAFVQWTDACTGDDATCTVTAAAAAPTIDVRASFGASGLLFLKSFGDNARDDYATDVAIDHHGNIYVVGSFGGGGVDASTIGFGDLPPVSSLGGSDGFLVKLDPGGDAQWALPMGGSSEDGTMTVAVDEDDNLYVGGEYYGALQIGGKTVDGIGSEGFVARVEPSAAAVTWAKSIGTATELDRVQAVAVRGGVVAVVGRHVHDSYESDAFVMLLDAATGAPRWVSERRYPALAADGTANVELYDVALLEDGRVIVGGTFGGSRDFGGGDVRTAPVKSYAVVLCLGADGSYQWDNWWGAADAPGPATSFAARVGSTSSAIFAAGAFAGNVSFGSAGMLDSGMTWDDVVVELDPVDGHFRNVSTLPQQNSAIWGFAIDPDSARFAVTGPRDANLAGGINLFVAMSDQPSALLPATSHTIFAGGQPDWATGAARHHDATVAVGYFRDTMRVDGAMATTSKDLNNLYVAKWLP